jgi:glycosyltransferase involved in cell wall biosynthesis
MKIYYVANVRMPTEKAHGIQLAKMCEALIEQGADLELIVPDVPNELGQSVREFYNLRCDIPLKKLPCIKLDAKGPWAFNLRAFSFAVSSYVYLAIKYLRGERNAVCYTIDLDQFSYFTLPLSGFPTFLEAHGSKVRTFFTKLFFRLCDGVIANSPGTLVGIKKMFSNELNDYRTMVHHNGIDLSSYQALPSKETARAKLGLPQNKKIVLYVGRFYDWKGLGITTRAATFVPGEVIWVFVGGNADEFRQAAGVSLPSTGRAMGSRPYREIPIWLAGADTLLVLGTQENEYSWLETSPMKLFEYMASGRPIVASATPANKEIVSDREVFFYTPDDERALAAAISRSIQEPKQAALKAAASLDRVKLYTWENRAREVLDFIGESKRLAANLDQQT